MKKNIWQFWYWENYYIFKIIKLKEMDLKKTRIEEKIWSGFDVNIKISLMNSKKKLESIFFSFNAQNSIIFAKGIERKVVFEFKIINPII